MASAASMPYSSAYEMPSPMSASAPAASPTSTTCGAATVVARAYVRIGNAFHAAVPGAPTRASMVTSSARSRSPSTGGSAYTPTFTCGTPSIRHGKAQRYPRSPVAHAAKSKS